jgi:hypothetical protein
MSTMNRLRKKSGKILFIIASNKITHPGINLMKEAKDLHNKTIHH